MVLQIIKDTYADIKVPRIIRKHSDAINNSLSKVSLIGLAGLACYIKPREFGQAVAIGALWQISLIVLKVQRPLEDSHCGPTDKGQNVSGMGCVDGYSKWFIGENPLYIEKIAGGTWLAAEHILKHPKHITFANFLGVCMGIRLMNFVRDGISGQQTEQIPIQSTKLAHNHHH